jgi:hypothetical protein
MDRSLERLVTNTGKRFPIRRQQRLYPRRMGGATEKQASSSLSSVNTTPSPTNSFNLMNTKTGRARNGWRRPRIHELHGQSWIGTRELFALSTNPNAACFDQWLFGYVKKHTLAETKPYSRNAFTDNLYIGAGRDGHAF